MVGSEYIFDAHSDLPFQVVRERQSGRNLVIEEDFLPEMRAGGITKRVAAIYVDDEYVPEMALHRALSVVSELHADIAESDRVELATTAHDLTREPPDDGATLVLGMEGAEPLMGDPDLLDVFYRLGLRVLTVTHSRRNALGDGVSLAPPFNESSSGLSETGFRVLERAGELGVVVDVSHLNPPGVADVAATHDQPLIASHSNCRLLCDHPRNLTDDQIRTIADSGGVVCLTAVGRFLSSESPTVEDLCDHVEHAVDVAGIDHVGLGFDFFAYLSTYLSEREQDRLGSISTTNGLEGDEDSQAVPAALRDRGFTSDEIAAVCHGNLERTVAEVLSS